MMNRYDQPTPPGPLQKIITFLAVVGLMTIFGLGAIIGVLMFMIAS